MIVQRTAFQVIILIFFVIPVNQLQIVSIFCWGRSPWKGLLRSSFTGKILHFGNTFAFPHLSHYRHHQYNACSQNNCFSSNNPKYLLIPIIHLQILFMDILKQNNHEMLGSTFFAVINSSGSTSVRQFGIL